jgi:hypothetical protein
VDAISPHFFAVSLCMGWFSLDMHHVGQTLPPHYAFTAFGVCGVETMYFSSHWAGTCNEEADAVQLDSCFSACKTPLFTEQAEKQLSNWTASASHDYIEVGPPSLKSGRVCSFQYSHSLVEVPYLYPPRTGWPSYIPGHWVPCLSPM